MVDEDAMEAKKTCVPMKSIECDQVTTSNQITDQDVYEMIIG